MKTQRLPGVGLILTKWMAESNSTTLRVNTSLVQAELIRTPEALRSEGLIDLENGDVLLGKSSLLEDLRDGLPWANSHEQRWNASNSSRDEFAHDFLSKLLRCGTLHKKHGGSTIRHLRCITSMNGTVLGKSRSDFGESL